MASKASKLIQPTREARRPRRAYALRALELLLVDGAPTVGWGNIFWHVSRFFFTKTNVTQKQKVEKSVTRYKMNDFSKGYTRAMDKILRHIAKNGFFGRKQGFQKKKPTS